MKALHVYILVGGIAIASSCSTANKSVNSSRVERPVRPTYKISYGPAGKIITHHTEAVAMVENADQQDAKTGNANKAPVRTDVKTVKKKANILKVYAKNTRSNYVFLVEQAQQRSLIYKHLEKASDRNEAGNPKKNGLAVAGFIASLVGLFIFGIILGILAIIFGAIGLESQRRGLAIAALIIGIVDIVAAVIIIGSL
jgi:hypothetical protein